MKDHFDFFIEQGNFPSNSNILIKNIGFSHNKPNYSYGYDLREYYILHYIISGSGTYSVNGKTYYLNCYDGFVVPPDTSVIYRADETNPWTVYWIGFYGNLAGYFLKRAKIDMNNLCFHYETDNQILSDMEALYSLVQKKNRNPELLLSYFFHILGTLSQQYQKAKENFTPADYFQSCVRFIENNIRLPIQVQDIAADLDLSYSHIYRIFKKQAQMTPHQYIDKVKIEKACDFIKNTNISYQQISMLLGYEYPSHFYKVFKKITGCTPSEYAQKESLH